MSVSIGGVQVVSVGVVNAPDSAQRHTIIENRVEVALSRRRATVLNVVEVDFHKGIRGAVEILWQEVIGRVDNHAQHMRGGLGRQC